MTITVYKSQTRGATIRGNNRAAQTSPIKLAGDPLLDTALDAAGKVTEAMFKKELEDQQIQQATDLMDEANAYYDETRKFEHDYKLNNKGKDARDAVEAFEKFHEDQANTRSERFAGNTRLQYMWKKQASQIRMGSLGRGVAYSESEDKSYRAAVTEQKTNLYFEKIAEAPNDAAVNNLRRQYNNEIAAINTPERTEILMDEADKKTAETRINTAIAQNDTEEAERLLAGYRKAGVLGDITDEMVKKVETAKVNKEAFDISQEIRATMPDATKTDKLDKVKELSEGDERIYKAARYQVIQDHSAEVSAKKEQDNLVTDMFTAKIQAAKTPEARKMVELEIMDTPMREPVRTDLLKKNAQGLKQPLTSDENRLREAEQKVAAEGITEQQLERDYKWHLSGPDYKLLKERLKEVGGNRVTQYNLDMEDRLSKAFAEDGKKTRGVKTKRFKMQMNQFVKEYQTKNGRLPSNQEMREQENWMLDQVIYDEDWVFHEKIERFMVDTLAADQFEVPKDVRDRIVRQMKAANMEVTEEKVVEAYRGYLLDKSNQKRR